MAADGDPRRFALGVGLDDIDLRARRVDADPEAGQLPIPEYGVLALGREPTAMARPNTHRLSRPFRMEGLRGSLRGRQSGFFLVGSIPRRRCIRGSPPSTTETGCWSTPAAGPLEPARWPCSGMAADSWSSASRSFPEPTRSGSGWVSVNPACEPCTCLADEAHMVGTVLWVLKRV